LKDSFVVESVLGHAKDVLRGDVVYQTDARNQILCRVKASFSFFFYFHINLVIKEENINAFFNIINKI
jgi:hypothetical protein